MLADPERHPLGAAGRRSLERLVGERLGAPAAVAHEMVVVPRPGGSQRVSPSSI